jgi:heptosyltransferase-2
VNRLVREPVHCSPCKLRECPIDHRCMTRISSDRVLEAARELLVTAPGADAVLAAHAAARLIR